MLFHPPLLLLKTARIRLSNMLFKWRYSQFYFDRRQSKIKRKDGDHFIEEVILNMCSEQMSKFTVGHIRRDAYSLQDHFDSFL